MTTQIAFAYLKLTADVERYKLCVTVHDSVLLGTSLLGAEAVQAHTLKWTSTGEFRKRCSTCQATDEHRFWGFTPVKDGLTSLGMCTVRRSAPGHAVTT